jgi:hypothetical protein
MIPKTFLLIEQVGSRTSQIDNLRAPVSILLKARTFKAVECITDSLTATDHTLVLVVSEGAFITDANEGCGTNVGITHGAFSVTLVAKSADGDAGLLAAHNKIGVVTRHDEWRIEGM